MRAKVDLSLETAVAEEARAPGLDLPRVAEGARAERNRRWREANHGALDAYAQEILREGPALARFRSF